MFLQIHHTKGGDFKEEIYARLLVLSARYTIFSVFAGSKSGIFFEYFGKVIRIRITDTRTYFTYWNFGIA